MKIYLSALIVLIVVLVAHVIGMQGLYMTFVPYDVFMHILGGIGVGLFMAALANSFVPKSHHKRIIIVIGTLIFGIVWELFEVRYNLSGYVAWTKPYYMDTVKDLIDDVVGGVLVSLAMYRARQ